MAKRIDLLKIALTTIFILYPSSTALCDGIPTYDKTRGEEAKQEMAMREYGMVDRTSRHDVNDDTLKYARALVEIKKYDLAIEEYKTIDKWLRHDPGLVIEFARVYTYADMHPEAVKLFEEVRTTHPEREAEILRELGDQYKWNGELKKSIEAYQRALGNNPNDTMVREGLADALDIEKKKGALPAAKSEVLTATRAIDERPLSNDDILAMARHLVEEKKYADAIAQYKKINDWLRHDTGLVIEFARVYTYADMHPEAIKLFEEARTAHPEREAEILRELGDQYKWNGDLEKAISAYEKGLKFNKEDDDIKKGLDEALSWKEKTANETTLSRARKLVEEKKYQEAIAEYEKISDWLHHDPELVIEFARVYTYADMHPEAIKLFEEARTTHPERESEMLRELGDQYKWNGNLVKSSEAYKKLLDVDPANNGAKIALAEVLAWNGRYKEALRIYDEVLGQTPDSLQALLAKADTLALMDRLEASDRTYKKALTIDPRNLKALNGRAKVRVWQGYHKKGAQWYRDILKDHPDNIEAMEGLAYALHWDGQDAGSAAVASRVIEAAPQRKASKELLSSIKQAAGPYVMTYHAYWNDKNKLSVETHGGRYGMHPDTNTLIEGIYEWQKSRQKAYYASRANRAGGGIQKRISEDVQINSYLYGTHFGNVDLSAFTTSSWVTWWMNDMWRFDASYNRSTFTDVGSILNKIIVDSPGISVDLKPNRYWLFSGSFARGFYSDDNIQNTVFCRAEYRITTKPLYSKFYYNYYYSGWSKLMNHGYFNPRKIDSHAWGIYASKDVTKKLFVEGQGSVGYEYQTPKAYHPTYYMGANINYRISDNWLASIKGELFRAYTDPNSNGYSKAGAMFVITYLMGAGEPGQAQFARGASRPETGK